MEMFLAMLPLVIYYLFFLGTLYLVVAVIKAVWRKG